MISSKVLVAAERNNRERIYNGKNSSELWGGLPVVLFFGDDNQLMPVNKDRAIHPGALYVTLSRAKTMGKSRSNTKFTE